MFSTTPTMTRGQKFESERQRRLKNRAEAMKTVIPYVVKDVDAQIDIESKEDPTKTQFNIYLTDILKNDALYSKSYFVKACGSTINMPYLSELSMFANAVLDASVGQDYEARVEANGERVCFSFDNVAKLAEKRISE
jgi:hypothetical protein